jgi:Domain of unknown function (DUF4388)
MTDRPPSAALPLYQTDLAQTPLPEILVKIHQYHVPGGVVCQRGEVNKRIYIDAGQITFASSNEPQDALGEKLVREALISPADHEEALRRLSTSGKRLGALLIEMGVIEGKALFKALREQISEIVWSIFAWPDGAVSFVPGAPKKLEFVRVEIPIPRAVLQGVRRMPDPRALVSRLGTKATIVARNPEIDPGPFALTDDEQKVYDAVTGKVTLMDLINHGPLAAGDNARILYGLYALQMISLKQPKQVKVQLKTDGSKYTR